MSSLIKITLILVILKPVLVFAHFTKNLYYGVSDKQVYELQRILNEKEAFYNGAIDGLFYTQTKKAVQQFQSKYGILPISGYVGLKTRAQLNSLYFTNASEKSSQDSKESTETSLEKLSLPPEDYLFTKITSSPANNSTIETDTVIIEFNGQDYIYPTSDLTFQTFIKGVDKDWQSTSSKKRTVSLKPGDNIYTFEVRAKRKNKEVDSNPAQVTFRAALSPYYKKIKISSVNYSTTDFNSEYLNIYNYNYNQPAVNVTSWQLSTFKEKFLLPQAVEFLTLNYNDKDSDIILNYGENLKIFSGTSPVSNNFKINKCFGYIKNLYQFSVQPDSGCPWPENNDLVNFSSTCRTFFSKIPQCTIPNLDDLSIVYDNDCRDYLRENLNYPACIAKYKKDDDFYKSKWWVYLNLGRKILDQKHDTLELRDKQGLIVNRYTY